MKKKKNQLFGLSIGKFFVLLLVVVASAYFVYQFMFVKNITSSHAACSNNYDCDVGEGCVKGRCQPKKDLDVGRNGRVEKNCECDTEFGECEDKWGYTNIKIRQCRFRILGKEKCNYRENGKFYQWVACE